MGLVNDLVSTSLSSMERRAQLLEEELARSRREAEARERELREAKAISATTSGARSTPRWSSSERARHAEELDALRAAAQRDLEQSLRACTRPCRGRPRPRARRSGTSRTSGTPSSRSAPRRRRPRRRSARRCARAERGARRGRPGRPRRGGGARGRAAVAYGEKLRAAAAAAPAAPAPAPAEDAPRAEPPPPPTPPGAGHTAREVQALEAALKSRESEISELRASSRREAAALWLAVGRAEDALAASSRSLVQHGALVAASWDSDDAGPPPPPPPRDRPHQPSADDDSALDSVVSDLDDLDARLARLRGRRAAAAAGAAAARRRDGAAAAAALVEPRAQDRADEPRRPRLPRDVLRAVAHAETAAGAVAGARASSRRTRSSAKRPRAAPPQAASRRLGAAVDGARARAVGPIRGPRPAPAHRQAPARPRGAVARGLPRRSAAGFSPVSSRRRRSRTSSGVSSCDERAAPSACPAPARLLAQGSARRSRSGSRRCPRSPS